VSEPAHNGSGGAAPLDMLRRVEDHAVLPSVVIERKVEWIDTDAAGHHHHSAVQRWVDAAETVLLQRRGVVDLFGRTPRVRYEVNYRDRLWFGQSVRIELAVGRVGEKSIRYDFRVSSGETLAADGHLFIAFAAPGEPKAVPWPPEVRAALLDGGPQQPERLSDS
jgi:acyl-CoA thioester hydrolase